MEAARIVAALLEADPDDPRTFLRGLKQKCLHCGSTNTEAFHVPLGKRLTPLVYRCKDCNAHWRPDMQSVGPRWWFPDKELQRANYPVAEITKDDASEIGRERHEESGPKMVTLKAHQKPLDDAERQQVMSAKAVWHHGPDGAESPAVKKSVVDGKTWYWCNTHRVYQAKSTLKAAIRAFHDVVAPSA